MGPAPTTHHYPLWQGAPYREPGIRVPARGPTRARAKPRPLGPRELCVAVALLIVADVALWTSGASRGGLSGGGLGLALLFALVPVLVLFAVRSWRASSRLGVVVALLVVVAARAAYQSTPLTVLCGAALVVAFALALRRRKLFVPLVFVAAFAGLAKAPARIATAATGFMPSLVRARLGYVSMLPIVVPTALVALFAAVFALGNPVIANGLGAAWAALSSYVIFPSVGRIVFWMVALVLGITLLRPAIRLATASEDAGVATSSATTTSLQVARNALVALNALFAVEAALDARYLWLGSAPVGMSTQQYAHEGAFWLTVALAMLTAVVGALFRGPLADDPRAERARRLAYVWMAQGLVLAAGTYRRIAIHVVHSGLSDLRIVGILGTTLVAVGVILIGLKLRRRKTFAWLIRRQLDAFAIMLVAYAVAPTHLISARVNVVRLLGGELRPALHVFRQSRETESAAALLPLLEHPDARIRQGVAALLDDERIRLRDEVARRASWRERDLATAWTLAALDRNASRMADALGATTPAEAKDALLDLVHAANGNVGPMRSAAVSVTSPAVEAFPVRSASDEPPADSPSAN